MDIGYWLIIIGMLFAFLKIGGRGKFSGAGLNLSASAGILLIVIGAIMVTWN